MIEGVVVERVAKLIKIFLPCENKEYIGIPKGKIFKSERFYAGDRVEGEVIEKDTFLIEKIKERKNVLIRPPVSNVDRVLCIVTILNPDFDNYLLDCLLVVYDRVGCEPVIIFNKVDLLSGKDKEELLKWTEIYREAGYEVVHISAKTGEGFELIPKLIKGNICILAGPSGVGKSSILKTLTGASLKTEDISRKRGRGRHTTTGVRLIPFGENSFLADTPGFSKVEPLQFVRKREIPLYFREFTRYNCRYLDCAHVREPGCAVKEALKKGRISCERYKSYLKMIKEFLEDLKEICS